MAATRKSPSTASRTKTVPVRIVKSATPRRPTPPPPPAPEPKVSLVRKVTRVDRRVRMMWTGVVLVAALVLFMWVGFAQTIYTSPNGDRETLFTKIGSELTAWFKKLRASDTASQEEELNDLRNRVFPKLKNEDAATFETVDANENGNTNAAINLNVSTTNESLNVNDGAR